MIKVIELFAGAGGLGIGFLLADHERFRFQPLFSVDIEKDAIETYRKNMQWLNENVDNLLPQPPKIYRKGVERLTARSVFRAYKMKPGDLDLLIGGPPCQGYSPSNRQTTKERKNELNNMIKIFMDKVCDFSPKMFLIENVQGVQWTEPTDEMGIKTTQLPLFPTDKPKAKDVRDYIISRATTLGYKVWHGILDAADYGVPQHRMRFFFFGMHQDFAGDYNVSLWPFLKQKRVQNPVTVNRAISDLPVIENGQKWSGDSYQPSNDPYVSFLRNYMKGRSLYDHNTTNHQPNIIERYKQIPEGKNLYFIKHLVDNYSDINRTHSNIYRRLIGDAPAHTISHYRKSMTIHPQQHRGLSFREACRLQSFPDWFRFHGGSDSCQQQLANAVPPLLAVAVAWAIAEIWARITNLSTIEPDMYDYNQEDFLYLLSEEPLETHGILFTDAIIKGLQKELELIKRA